MFGIIGMNGKLIHTEYRGELLMFLSRRAALNYIANWRHGHRCKIVPLPSCR